MEKVENGQLISMESGESFTPQLLLLDEINGRPFVDVRMNAIDALTLCASHILKKDFRYRLNVLQDLYQGFLRDYHKLVDEFGFVGPHANYEMFYYLLHHGYLSQGKNFQYVVEKNCDIDLNHLGIKVFSGKGVCRHQAGLLADILNEIGYRATEVFVFTTPYYILGKGKGVPLTEEEVIEWFQENLVDKRRFWTEVYRLREKGRTYEKYSLIELKDEKEKSKNYRIGNHAITFATFHGENYFMDPTNHRLLRRNEQDGKLYDKWNSFRITFLCRGKKNSRGEDYVERLRQRMQENYPSPSLSVEKLIRTATIQVLEDNPDLLEEFFTDHEQLYEEMAYQYQKLK